MKTLRLAFMAMGMAMAATILPSCLDDDDDNSISIMYPNALVTVKTADDSSLYLQLDDKTTLLPTNMTKSPYGDKEVRALVNFTETNEDSQSYTKAVHINWIDSILTKTTVAAPTTAEDSTKYGNDPVEIIKDWVTIAEDGYLTLRFSTRWGTQGTKHFVNLLTGTNPDNPYEVEFRHNAYGDVEGKTGDALVAFSLADLPDTEGQTVKLTLKWKSFSGDKSAEFDYCSRQSTEEANMLHGQTQFVTSLE